MLRCSFCRKTENQVERMLQGDNGYICNECVFASFKMLYEAELDEFEGMLDELGTPELPERNALESDYDIAGVKSGEFLKPAEVKKVLDKYIRQV